MSLLSNIFGTPQAVPTAQLPMQPAAQGLQPLRFNPMGNAAQATGYGPAVDTAPVGATAAMPTPTAKVTLAVKQALQKLGLFHGTVNNTPDKAMKASVLAFQRKAGLKATGTVDSKTRTALRAAIVARPAAAAAPAAAARADVADPGAGTGPQLPANGNPGTVPPYLANPTYSGSPTMPGASNILPGDTPGEVAAWQARQAAMAAGQQVPGEQLQSQPQRNVTNQRALSPGGNLAVVPGLGLSLVGGVAAGAGTSGAVPTLTGVGGTTGPVAPGLVAPPGFAQPAGSTPTAGTTGDGSVSQHVSNTNALTGSSRSMSDGGMLGYGGIGGIGGFGMPANYTAAQGWGAPTWSGAPAGLAYGSYGFGAQAATNQAMLGQNQASGGFFSRLFGR